MRTFLKRMHDQYPTLMEIVRFGLVGGLATAIDYIVMFLVQYIAMPELYPDLMSIFTAEVTGVISVVASGVGFTVSLVVNYLLSVLFVFEEKGKSKSVYGFVMFAVLSGVGLLLHVVGMYLGNNILGINEWLVKLFMTAVVLVWNYLSRKLLLFKKDQSKE